MKQRKSLRKSINEKCKDCIYDQIGGQGTWRQQVEACLDKACPLYDVRPVSESSRDTMPEEV